MKNKRELSFDILRVISMIMVIIIHVANVYCRDYGIINNNSYLISLVFNTISRISVPLFFMISGALLLNQSFDKEKYKKRLFKYIIIILFWNIFYLIWEYFYLNIKYDNLYMLIIQPFRAHLWFLYTIIVLYLLQPILKIILEKISKRNRITLLILWFIISSLGLINTYIANYFSIFTYIGYFILGKYLYDFSLNNNLKKYSIFLSFIMIICYTLSIILNYVVSINTNSFFNLFFAYKTPFIILSSIAFYIIIISKYKNKTKQNIIINYLSKISLGVYLIHGVFLDITIKIFNYSSIKPIIGIPIFTTFIFMLSSISVILLRKLKFFNNILL